MFCSNFKFFIPSFLHQPQRDDASVVVNNPQPATAERTVIPDAQATTEHPGGAGSDRSHTSEPRRVEQERSSVTSTPQHGAANPHQNQPHIHQQEAPGNGKANFKIVL